MRLPTPLLLALLTVASVRAEAPPIGGTLPEDAIPELVPLLKAAVERSPNSIMASIAVAQSDAANMSGKSILWPVVSASSSFQGVREKVSQVSLPSSSSGFFYGASVSQPVFQWGAYKNQAAMGELGLKIAERQYADAYRQLAVLIRQEYLGLIAKTVVLRNTRFNLKLQDEQLAAEQAKFDSGASSSSQLESYKMLVVRAQLDVDRAAEDLAYGKQIFLRLVGIDSLADASIPATIPHAEYAKEKADLILTGFVGEGIESTFQSQIYDLNLRQQGLNYDIQKVRLLPKVNANASYSYSNYTSVGANSITQEGVTSESYSVAANWTIFDGFATRAAKLSALENKRLYERLKKNYVDSTIDTITYMRQQIDFSARSLALAESSYSGIVVEVKRLDSDRALGYTSQATIDAGTQTEYATEYQMVLARADFFNNWVQFISLAGIDPALTNISPRYVR